MRSRIIAGEWELHTRIPSETALASEYEVSRGTIREAIHSLTELGIVETAVGRGTFVRSRVPTNAVLVSMLSERDPIECFELRASIEGEAARTLAGRGDASAVDRLSEVAHATDARERLPGEFHTRLVEAACAPLSVSIHAATLLTIRNLLFSGRITQRLHDETRDEAHDAIVAAIRSGDPARAAELAADHARTDMIPVDPAA